MTTKIGNSPTLLQLNKFDVINIASFVCIVPDSEFKVRPNHNLGGAAPLYHDDDLI